MSDDSVNISRDAGEGRSLAVESDAGSIDLNFKRDKRRTQRPTPRPRPTPKPKPTAVPQPTASPPELHAFINARKDLPVQFDDNGNVEVETQPEEQAEQDYGGYYSDGSAGNEEENQYGSGSEVSSAAETQPLPPHTSIREEKEALLLKLYKLRKQGHPVPEDVDFNTDIHELRFCVKRVEDELSTEGGVEMAKHALIFSVGMIEMLNEQYNPFDLHLRNFSHDVMSQINTFDRTLEQLVEKYKARVSPPPELALVFSLVAIGASTHMRESKKAKMTAKTAQPGPQSAQPSSTKQQTATGPVRREMPAPSIGMNVGSILPFPQPSRAPLGVQPPQQQHPVSPPVPSRLAPEPRKVEMVPLEESTDSEEDRMSDVITERIGKDPDSDDGQSVYSGHSQATTRTRAKRRKTPAAPPPTGRIVTI